MVKRLKRAFTITELVIVIAVIAILAAVLIPTLSNVMSSANKSAALSTCRNALTNLEGVYAEDGKTASDLDGTVFVSDGYAYAFINSSLQYVGELEDLAGVSASGTATADKTYTIAYSGSDNTGSNTLSLSKGTTYGSLTWGGTTIGFGSGTEEENYYYTGANAETTKSAESLYIYEIEINSTTYYGFFTYEADNALYQTEAATYSRLQGYSSASITSSTEKVADIMPTITFNNIALYKVEITSATTSAVSLTLTMNNGTEYASLSAYQTDLSTTATVSCASSNTGITFNYADAAFTLSGSGTSNLTVTVDNVTSAAYSVTLS